MATLVAGAGGFIGGHLVKEILSRGEDVIAVDIKPIDEWYQRHDDAVSIDTLDLSSAIDCGSLKYMEIQKVYNLAADMGGMGFIESHKADCMFNVMVNTNLLKMFVESGQLPKYFFASSACIYPDYLQRTTKNAGLKESDAYPAMPEDGYGWEKLFSERMCLNVRDDYGMDVRVGRYHNIYGPFTSYDGGREKAPAAICRKVIEAKMSGSGSIDIWGDGEQTRSFTYVDDCVHGTIKLMDSDFSDPLNIGSDHMVSINQLVDIVEQVADYKVKRNYDLSKPKGVRGRNSDNGLIKKVLKWHPETDLVDGMEETYKWIWDEMNG